MHTFNDLSALGETATFIGSIVYEIRSKNPIDPRLIPIALAVRDMAIEARKSTQKRGINNHDFEAALSYTGTPQAIEYLTKNSDTHYLLKYAQNIQNIRDFSVRRERFKTWKEMEEEQHTLARRRTENKDRDQYAYYREETDDFQDFEDEIEHIDDETNDEDDEYEGSAERSEEANKCIEMLLDIFEKVAAIRNQQAQRREERIDANYEFFPYEQERKELFEYCSAIAEYLKAEKIPNLVIIDRSSRPLYVGVKEYLRQKYPNDRGPNMYFMNPLGFKTPDNLSPSEARDLIMDEGFKGDTSVKIDQIRQKKTILEELKKTYPRLLSDKNKPVLIFDTCLHSGNTLRPVTETLHELGFTDARVGSVNPSDARSHVKTDFYITTRLPEKGCYPFDRDRMVEKTLDHVYSKRTDEPVKRLAAHRLREEIKKIMQEQLSAATSIKSAPHTYTDNLNLHHSSQHQRFSRPKHGGGH